MRVLWIGKQPRDGEAGDEVFDRKTIAALRSRGVAVDLFHPARASRLRELANLLSGIPHYRARYATAANLRAVRGRAGDYDGVICSWEPLDVLARTLVPPGVLIAHNITSRSLPALFPGNRLAAFAGARARGWERRWYSRDSFAAIAALSRRDLGYLRQLPAPPPLLLLPPGMPPCTELAGDAVLIAELVISGTYDWVPKRRDIMRFASQYSAVPQRLPVRAAALPAAARDLLQPLGLPSDEDLRTGIRFGVITDRFEAGHKLKTMAYIAANQIVLSFADVAFDFADIPDADLFIRRVGAAGEIAAHVGDLAAMPPPELRQRFSAFQQRCARQFTWDAVAAGLIDAIASPAASGQDAIA